jgi:hypothetical protein
MKRIGLLLFFIGILSFNSNAQYHERDWKWYPYASLTKSGKNFVVLYYGKNIKGYDGKIRWKIENKAAKPLFGADLAAQTYKLKSGKVVNHKGVNFKTRRIKPGETAMTLAITIEENAKTGITNVDVEKPEITLDFGQNKIYEWNKLGTIEIAPQ